MDQNVKNLLYLLSCSVNNIVPDKKKLAGMDIDELYSLSKIHTLRACVYTALKAGGIDNNDFSQAYNKAVRKTVLLDTERNAILSEFEKNGIWYLPLKGIILKTLYPKLGMREMADNDILYDRNKQDEVRKIMLSKGYSAEEVGKGYHDVYMKPPVMNFELHTAFFGINHPDEFRKIYSDPKRIMKTDEGKIYGRHLSDEDFYVFITAHEWKHFIQGGTGLRSLLDCYVYINRKGNSLDWEYITSQLDILGIKDYEKQRRLLAEKIFSSPETPELSDAETDLLEKYIIFGTYGTIDNKFNTRVDQFLSEDENNSKAKYILRCIFPPSEHMKKYFPFFYKHKLLLPLGYVWRWIRAIFTRSHIIRYIIRSVRNKDDK